MIKKYYFINKFDTNNIDKQDKQTNIIFRNYSAKPINEELILKIKKYCKKKSLKFYLSNNFKLAIKLNLDGVYIPSFNKKLIPNTYRKNKFYILGSAHNLKEILEKKKQGVEYLFISPLFKIKKRNYFLGPTKYNILANHFHKRTIALGGLNNKNISTVNKINCFGFASISYIEKYKING